MPFIEAHFIIIILNYISVPIYSLNLSLTMILSNMAYYFIQKFFSTLSSKFQPIKIGWGS